MEILNHAEAAQVTFQSALSVVLQPFLRAQSVRGVLKHLVVLAAGFATAVAGTAWGTEPPAAVVSDAPLGHRLPVRQQRPNRYLLHRKWARQSTRSRRGRRGAPSWRITQCRLVDAFMPLIPASFGREWIAR
jgi:hypothetical protein